MRLTSLAMFAGLGALALASAACGRDGVDRVGQHAALTLGVDHGDLRVSAQSDLTSPRNTIHLVTQDGAPVLFVVEPRGAALFDSRSPGAFDRVARDEDAANRLSILGPERVALWFGALGGGICPAPISSEAHFVTVARDARGVTLRYAAGLNQTCVLSLAADGAMREARLVSNPTPEASVNGWRSDLNN